MKQPMIVAHRGASQDGPENTMAAFRLAWEQGADAVETDLRLTADGVIVAFHDADGRRILRDHRRICDLPLADLQKLDAGRWKHDRWQGELVPTLRKLIDSLPAGKNLVLELKENVVPQLTIELGKACMDQITLIAFDAEIIAEAKRQLPGCQALWLFGDYASISARPRGDFLARRVRELKIDGLDLRHARSLDESLLVPLHEEGRTIFTYTVNSPASIRRCARLGLDGLTTDRPGDARSWLGIST